MLTGCGGSKSLKMATGGTTGLILAFGGAVSQVLSSKLIMSSLMFNHRCFQANIYLVADGEADIAIVQNDVMYYAVVLISSGESLGFSALPGIC